MNDLIRRFQCPGCIHGHDCNCEKFELLEADDWFMCASHHPATYIVGIGLICLGLPKGFCRTEKKANHEYIRIHKNKSFRWDKLNVAVWALEHVGFLFVRTYMPRIGRDVVDVIPGGTLDLVPNAYDVDKFIDDID